MKKRIVVVICGLFVCGCSGQVHGLSLGIGSFERCLFTDRDRRNNDPNNLTWGFVFQITIGQWLRPMGSADGNNPWKGGKPAYVIRSGVPLPGLFLGLHLGQAGLYLGTKTYEVTDKHRERYGQWMHKEEFGTDDKPKYYLCPSARYVGTRLR